MRAQRLWLPGKMPGLDELIRTAKDSPADYVHLKQRWVNTVARRASAAKLRPCRHVRLTFTWHGTGRRRDIDRRVAGGRKLVLDGLVAGGVLPVDGCKSVAGWTDEYRVSAKRGVLITLRAVAS